MITRRLIVGLGAAQLVLWGVTYYQIAVFGQAIGQETGWSRTLVFGGFSAGLLVMAAASGPVGRLVDARGGRIVLTAGSVLSAVGCLGVAVSRDLPTYYSAWAVLGLAMRMSLYDAAFAALARIGGAAARKPISQITLLGGLASTVLWPLGEALQRSIGWRSALVAYAGLALLTVPLHLAIPVERHDGGLAGTGPLHAPLAETADRRRKAGLLYGTVVMLTAVLNSAMSAHMIAILAGLGLTAAAAVSVASLRGIGQAAARLGEVLAGHRIDPFRLGVWAAAATPIGFGLGFFSGVSTAAGIGFALTYGAGNGLLTITRGTQPLLLFDPREYGRVVGRLIGPSFVMQAAAPTAFAAVLDSGGARAALWLAVAIGILALAGAAALDALFGRTAATGGNARAPTR